MKIFFVTVCLLFLIPTMSNNRYPYSFDNWADYSHFYKLQKYHGALSVSTDFLKAYRCDNGEYLNLGGRK